MVQYSRVRTFRKLIQNILILVIITAALVAAFLIYKGNFNNVAYSNWLFYASMSYILLGGLSIYGSTMSTNSIGYKYASTVMSSNYEQRKKIDDMLLNTGLHFSMKMIAVGIFLLLVSAGADRLL